MEPDEVALSDVHIYTENQSTPDHTAGDNLYPVVRSRFVFHHRPDEEEEEEGEENEEIKESVAVLDQFDEDGDLVVKRRCVRQETSVINIEHSMATRLVDVGLQVWRGALLLSDYILHQRELFSDCVAMELGAGVGLVSITLATVAKQVFCTDTGADVLQTCSHNVENNKHLFRGFSGDQGDLQAAISVRELNWKNLHPYSGISAPWSWSDADLKMLDKTTVLMAADVVYDDSLTEAFFATIRKLMLKPPAKTLYVALEKRFCFTLEDLDVACPAYRFFRNQLEKLTNQCKDEEVEFSVHQLSTDFPQYFNYDRAKQMELWRISSILKER